MGLSSQSLISVILRRQITRCPATHAPSVQNPLFGRAWTAAVHVQSRLNVTSVLQRARGNHLASNMEEEQKYRRVQLGAKHGLEDAFQTLLVFMKDPTIAGQLRQLEVYGSSDVQFNCGLNFNIPPMEPRQLGLDDLNRLKMTIKRAGFIEGNEAQILLHILLHNPSGEDMYVTLPLAYAHMAWKSLTNQSTRRQYHSLADMMLKQAIAALLITMSPNLESLSVFPLG